MNQIIWDESKSTTFANCTERWFLVSRDGIRIPGILWSPAYVSKDRPLPLVLVSHGGSGHKRASLVTDFVAKVAESFECHVMAIDGPVHGSRRETFVEGPVVRDEFLQLWAQGGAVESMVKDWQTALTAVLEQAAIDSERVGWYGLSMGTAYGVPLLAADARISAALIGMWGLNVDQADVLRRNAPYVKCPLLFQQQWDDEIFPRDAQIELFALLGSAEKRLQTYPGTHTNPSGERIQQIVAFFASAFGQRSTGISSGHRLP